MKAIGGEYEEMACDYLESKGFRIVERGYISPMGEIDIIAVMGDFICFVEVKGRGENSLYSPLEAVTHSKQKKIIKTAVSYIKKNGIALQPRFDVVAIDSDKNIEHIENAFGSRRYYI